MKSAIFFSSILGLALGSSAQSSNSTEAPVVTDNPVGATYEALFVKSADIDIRGSVSLSSGATGTGAIVDIDLFGLPDEELGPFSYHIHVAPVPMDGDCAGTEGHLDPYGRTDEPPCDPETPNNCEVGDLSGKWGTVEGASFRDVYLDPYVSLEPDTPAFAGNGSITIHDVDGNRITCATLVQLTIPVEEEEDEEECD
ncbi:hypothetical protein FQN54_003967 [Arachnomyces sp. PD_36]|nr:hypothetical protein FQN54_003967 [Arachnomyces sp. PD_36]